jgi:hypothetical protein
VAGIGVIFHRVFGKDKGLTFMEKKMRNDWIWGGLYGSAFIGAAIYFIQHAASFWNGVWGFFKALFWPAVLMYKLLEYLKM